MLLLLVLLLLLLVLLLLVLLEQQFVVGFPKKVISWCLKKNSPSTSRALARVDRERARRSQKFKKDPTDKTKFWFPKKEIIQLTENEIRLYKKLIFFEIEVEIEIEIESIEHR